MVLPFQNNLKNLVMCADLHFWDCFERENTQSYSQMKIVDPNEMVGNELSPGFLPPYLFDYKTGLPVSRMTTNN